MLEFYFGTHTPNTPWQWASAGKTFTSFMVGIAQQEDHLTINDTTSNYLGAGWTDCTPSQEEKITIRHQLTMTSGLDDEVPDHYCTLDTCLIYKAEAGTRWAYHNGPYTLLDGVIEQDADQTLNAYTTQKLKIPTGTTGSFIKVGYNNVYFSTARSMTRFGLFFLNRGNWNGQQIMTDTGYFSQMISTSQSLNLSCGYLWWLNGKQSYMLSGSQFVFNGYFNPNAPADIVAAMGKDGQFLNIVPDSGLVWLRVGNAPDGLPVPFLMNDKILEHINALDCNAVGLGAEGPMLPQMLMFYEKDRDILVLKASDEILAVELFSPDGRLTIFCSGSGKDWNIPLHPLRRGVYVVRAKLRQGQQWSGKLIN